VTPAGLEPVRAEGVAGGLPAEAGIESTSRDVRSTILAALIPDGEIIILAVRPSRWFIVLSVAALLVLLAATAALGWWIDVGGAGFLPTGVLGIAVSYVPLVATGGAALLVGWQGLEWLTRIYVLTDRRVMRVSGVLRQTTVDMPLRRVQHVILYRSIRERLFGLGTLGFASAGGGGGGAIDFAWYMITRPAERLELVRRTIERYAGGGGGGAAGASGGRSAEAGV
jgi:membrane protein YdbS with pleckstrin-like domain